MHRSLLLLLASCFLSLPAVAQAGQRIAVLTRSKTAPTHALVQALRKDGHVVLDETRLADLVGGVGALNVGAVDVPRPRWWPPALEADWKQATDACKAEGGKPPYNLRNRGAFACGRRIAPALQQRYLEHRAPAVVLEVDVRLVGTDMAFSVTRFAVDRTSTLRLEGSPVDGRRAKAELARIGRRVLAGEGTPGTRTIDRELPSAAKGWKEIAPTLQGTSIKAAKFERPCPVSLPQALAVSPAETLASQALVATWKETLVAVPSIPGDERERSCTLETQVVLGGGPGGAPSMLHRLMGFLDCGDDRIEARTFHVKPDSPSAAASLARKLVERSLEQWCQPPRMAQIGHRVEGRGVAKIGRGGQKVARAKAKQKAVQSVKRAAGQASLKKVEVLSERCTKKTCTVTVLGHVEENEAPRPGAAPVLAPAVTRSGPVLMHLSGIVGPTHLQAFRERLLKAVPGIRKIDFGPIEEDRARFEIQADLDLAALRAGIQGQARGIFQGTVEEREDGSLSLAIQR